MMSFSSRQIKLLGYKNDFLRQFAQV